MHKTGGFKQVTINVTPDDGMQFLVTLFVPEEFADNSEEERNFIGDWLNTYVVHAREWQR